MLSARCAAQRESTLPLDASAKHAPVKSSSQRKYVQNELFTVYLLGAQITARKIQSINLALLFAQRNLHLLFFLRSRAAAGLRRRRR
jgi:hypothetical protein